MGLFLGDSEPSKIFVGDTSISKVFLGDTKVRPSTTPVTPRTPDASRTILYLQLNNNVNDSSGNSVAVSSNGISFGTIGNNHYAQLTATSGHITPTASIGRQIGTGDFTVSFYFYPIANVGQNDRAWLFGDWYDNSSPRPGICVRWTTIPSDYVGYFPDGTGAGGKLEIACSIDTWHYLTYVRINGENYCYLDGDLVGHFPNSYNFYNVNKFYILNRSDYAPQRWGTAGARISEVIFEKVGWAERDIEYYYSQTKGNYGL